MARNKPTLYILGGLPATGKSTIAKALSRQTGAAWIRIDTIEQRLLRFRPAEYEIGGEGYEIAYDLAADNLRNGLSVIADSVNPIELTRAAWRDVADKCHSSYFEIELYCSNAEEHRRRAESRVADIPGHILPTWEEIVQREYHPWENIHLRLDTYKLSVDQIVRSVSGLGEK